MGGGVMVAQAGEMWNWEFWVLVLNGCRWYGHWRLRSAQRLSDRARCTHCHGSADYAEGIECSFTGGDKGDNLDSIKEGSVGGGRRRRRRRRRREGDVGELEAAGRGCGVRCEYAGGLRIHAVKSRKHTGWHWMVCGLADYFRELEPLLVLGVCGERILQAIRRKNDVRL